MQHRSTWRTAYNLMLDFQAVEYWNGRILEYHIIGDINFPSFLLSKITFLAQSGKIIFLSPPKFLAGSQSHLLPFACPEPKSTPILNENYDRR